MHEEELRALVRDAIARHLGEASAPPGQAARGADSTPDRQSAWKIHPSHGRFVFLAPVERDAPCVVEPQVTCHHCGFCQSYGH